MEKPYPDRLIEGAKGLAQKCFDDAKEDIDNYLHSFSGQLLEQELNKLSDELSKQVTAAIRPTYIYSEEKIKENLSENNSSFIMEQDFKLWYDSYQGVLKEKNKTFISRAMKFKSILFEDDGYYDGEAIYESNKRITSPEDDIQMFLDYFVGKVHLLVLTCYYYKKHQTDYIEERIRQLDKIKTTGLNCPFDRETKIKLLKECQDKGIIDPEVEEDDFVAALSPENNSFKPVKWIKTHSNKPHKSSMGAFFFTVVPGKTRLDGNGIKRCFVDINGSPFIVGKLKQFNKEINDIDPSYKKWLDKFQSMLSPEDNQ